MSTPGTATRPLRVAIVGSGPSGFFSAAWLQKRVPALEIDMFERLPTPYGLVRGGVAPDHPEIKSVVRVFERAATQPGFAFFGNVEVGRDIAHEELARHYDAVIYAVGAQADRRLGIPGEDLPGIHAATEFVGWYNGHPDYRGARFDLSHEDVALVGLGNVALDMARILASPWEALRGTDIAPHALEALRASKVKTIHLLGRRGPVQAAFTPAEIRELGDLPEADVVLDPGELLLDGASRAELAREQNAAARENLEILAGHAARGGRGRARRIVLRFLVSPVAFHGEGRVAAMTLASNRLEPDGAGGLRAVPSGETQVLPVGLVLRSVGYRGVPLPGLPFDARRAVVPNARGRVLAAPGGAQALAGVYVAGWIKRGPSGVIGTNKPDAEETVSLLLQDLREGRLAAGEPPGRAAIRPLLAARGVEVFGFDDWRELDRLECARGLAEGRPRIKFCRVEEMLQAVRPARRAAAGGEAQPPLAGVAGAAAG